MPPPQERPKREQPGEKRSRRRRIGEQKLGVTGKEQIHQPPLLAVVNELVTKAGVHDQFQTGLEFHIRLEQEPYMPLVIESWPAMPVFRSEKRHISVAHYYYQEGDAIADPDVLMTDQGEPIELTQVFGYTRVMQKSEGPNPVTQVSERAKRGVEGLMKMWAQNIRDQGWLEVAKKYKQEHQLTEEERLEEQAQQHLDNAARQRDVPIDYHL